jgi:O-antigen/teichoic acid export membrane protein
MVAVSYYVTPYEVVTKLLLIPSALMAVLFPAFTLAGSKDRRRAIILFDNSINFIVILLSPIVILSNTFAYEGLYYWLGLDFSINSTTVFQLITIGVYFNSIAQAPYGLIQSHGRPDLTAKLHVSELPFYFLILWISIVNYGIVGAAFAWMLRSMVDMIMLFEIARKLLSLRNLYIQKRVLLMLATLICMSIGSLLHGVFIKSVFTVLTFGFFVPSVWFYVLSINERITLFKFFRTQKLTKFLIRCKRE